MIRVLVADDSPTVATVLSTALALEGYEVVVANDGLEAYEEGIAGHFDLVLIDQMMPGLLGLEVIERWQRQGIDHPVMVLSGVDDDDTVLGGVDEGAIDFVRKPFRLPELLERIRDRMAEPPDDEEGPEPGDRR